ncbi:Gfo/Idh/MocA family protein, partial [Ralstonia pseudosolanacearum]|uniref:Gfo/Idh/MocA family protein n=1 Tax=Ralstonia pseudosolanacearum TaxID=1310165 RepID=UPI003D16DC9A
MSAYLGPDRAAWRAHDACALIEDGQGTAFDDILIDQGLADSFLENQLKPELIEAAAAKAGVPLACGHQERVVFQAMGLLDIPEQPLRLEAVRRGTPSDRNLDVSVVLDLMIHDIDLALALCDGEPIAVEGEGAITRSTSLDWVKAEATFDNGFTALFDSSRVAEARERT